MKKKTKTTSLLESSIKLPPCRKEDKASLLIVQFLHPGTEYSRNCFRPRTGNLINKLWSPVCSKGHHRSFLQCEGEYRNGNGKAGDGLLNFWGEWEGSADVEKLEPSSGNSPRWLLKPRHPLKTDSGMNTDPFVFNGPFRYSFCQQATCVSLRKLAVGSMVLFGSCRGKQFLLDTVFVVGKNCGMLECYSKNKSLGLFGQMNITPILRNPGGRQCSGKKTCGDTLQASVYEGATPETPVNGIYSFVPARLSSDKESVFARPVLGENVFRAFISPRLSQGVKNTPASTEAIVKMWKQLKQTLCKQGFVLGVNFKINP